MVVVTPIQVIVTLSIERGYQQIIHCYLNSEIRVTKTGCPYGTKFCGLIVLIVVLFPTSGRNQTSVLLTHTQKKKQEQIINNYRPVSLSVFGKMFENLTFKSLLNILMNKNCSQNISRVSNEMIHVQINYCILLLLIYGFQS